MGEIETAAAIQCDHCFNSADFRVAVVAWHGDTFEQLHYCTERFQQFVAEEPQRVAGVMNLHVDTTLPLIP